MKVESHCRGTLECQRIQQRAPAGHGSLVQEDPVALHREIVALFQIAALLARRIVQASGVHVHSGRAHFVGQHRGSRIGVCGLSRPVRALGAVPEFTWRALISHDTSRAVPSLVRLALMGNCVCCRSRGGHAAAVLPRRLSGRAFHAGSIFANSAAQVGIGRRRPNWNLLARSVVADSAAQVGLCSFQLVLRGGRGTADARGGNDPAFIPSELTIRDNAPRFGLRRMCRRPRDHRSGTRAGRDGGTWNVAGRGS